VTEYNLKNCSNINIYIMTTLTTGDCYKRKVVSHCVTRLVDNEVSFITQFVGASYPYIIVHYFEYENNLNTNNNNNRTEIFRNDAWLYAHLFS